MHETQVSVLHAMGIQSAPHQTRSIVSVPQAEIQSPHPTPSGVLVSAQDVVAPPSCEPPELQAGNSKQGTVNFAEDDLQREENPMAMEGMNRGSKRASVTGIVNELRETVFNKQVRRMNSALAEHRVMVNRNLLKQRLLLEYKLVVGSWKLLRWFICVFPLIWCLNIFEPGTDIGNVHEMLIDHYGIGHNALLNLKEWDHVYSFFHRFKEQNDLLEPTGKIFWCDPRYLDILGITNAGRTEFLRQNELASLVASASAIVSGGSGSGL
jgi:hypothetical protein